MKYRRRTLQTGVSLLCLVSGLLACSDGEPVVQEPEPELPILQGSEFDLGFGACGGVEGFEGYQAYSYGRDDLLGLRVSFGSRDGEEGWHVLSVGQGALIDLLVFEDPSPTYFCDDVGAEVVLEEWEASQGTVQVWLGPFIEGDLREVEVRLDRVLFEEVDGDGQQLLDHLTIGRSTAGWLPG